MWSRGTLLFWFSKIRMHRQMSLFQIGTVFTFRAKNSIIYLARIFFVASFLRFYFWLALLFLAHTFGCMVFGKFWGCCAVCSLYTKSFVNGTGKMSWMTWRIRSRRWTVLWLVFSQIFWLFWALCSSIFSAQRFSIFCGMVDWKERHIWFIG